MDRGQKQNMSKTRKNVENTPRVDFIKIAAEQHLILQDAENNNKKWSTRSIPGIGIFCALLSGLLFSINSVMVKMIDLHPAQLSLSRCSVQVLVLLPLLQYKHKEVDITGPEGLKLVLLARGFVGSTAMVLLYFSIDYLSVGNAVTITYLSMIMVPFVARILLKESLTPLDLIFAAVALVGVVLIAQPQFLFPVADGEQPQSAIGIMFAVLCATCIALSIITLRKLGRATYPPLNVLYYSFCGSFTTTIILALLGEFQFPCWNDLPLVFSLGLVGVVAQFFLTLALQNERASTVGVLRSVQIIIVYVLQITVLGDIPSFLSLVGAALVFSCSIGIGVRKIVNERKRRQSISKSETLAE